MLLKAITFGLLASLSAVVKGDNPIVKGFTPGDVNAAACGGPENVASQDVTEEKLANGDTKKTTISKCKDGTKHRKVETYGSTVELKIDVVQMADFQANFENDYFILNNFDDEDPPPGYHLVTGKMFQHGLWGYFATYYFAMGGVYSIKGWSRSASSNFQICIAGNFQLKTIHKEQDLSTFIRPHSDFQVANVQTAGSTMYQICSDDQTCYDNEAAQLFRALKNIIMIKDKKCKNYIGLWVKEKFLIDIGIPLPEIPNPNPNPNPSGCQREGGCAGQLPINVFIGGRNVKLGSWTFILGVHDVVNLKKYVIVTPKMLNLNFWFYFKKWYTRFQSIKNVGPWDHESICLGPIGKGYRIKSFVPDDHEPVPELDSVDDVLTYADEFAIDNVDKVTKYNLCYNGVCYDDPAVFREKLSYNVNKDSCGGNMNLYVQTKIYNAIIATWTEEEHSNVNVDVDNVTTAAPTTTEKPGPPDCLKDNLRDLAELSSQLSSVEGKNTRLENSIKETKELVANFRQQIDGVINTTQDFMMSQVQAAFDDFAASANPDKMTEEEYIDLYNSKKLSWNNKLDDWSRIVEGAMKCTENSRATCVRN